MFFYFKFIYFKNFIKNKFYNYLKISIYLFYVVIYVDFSLEY